MGAARRVKGLDGSLPVRSLLTLYSFSTLLAVTRAAPRYEQLLSYLMPMKLLPEYATRRRPLVDSSQPHEQFNGLIFADNCLDHLKFFH